MEHELNEKNRQVMADGGVVVQGGTFINVRWRTEYIVWF